MNSAIPPEELKDWIEPVYLLYAGLSRDLDPATGLGGKLIYAGELDPDGCWLVRAANIAGAASLSATADTAAQRQAIREGVVDFLVTSLDEALRILKNEIRKRNPVAVGISKTPALVAEEMRVRGVLPDLIPHSRSLEDTPAQFIAQGAQVVKPDVLPAGSSFCVFANPPADFESRALALIPESDHAARRWLRLSPRYLGPQLRRVRSLACQSETAAALARECMISDR